MFSLLLKDLISDFYLCLKIIGPSTLDRVVLVCFIRQETWLAIDVDLVSGVNEWRGELRVDIREWRDDKPMRKGVSLTLMRWKNWVNQLELAEKALHEKKSYSNHIRGNVYCTVAEYSVCVDIRQY